MYITQEERDIYHAHLSDNDAQWLNRKLMTIQAHMLNIMKMRELSGNIIDGKQYICTEDCHHSAQDAKASIDNF